MTPAPRIPRASAAAVARGAARTMAAHGAICMQEFSLADGRRADLFGLDAKGAVVIIEVKSAPDDFLSDEKWPDYQAWCDRFFFAVGPRFPTEILPADTGLIIADAFDGAIVRPSPERRLPPARRKAVTLRFARAAAERLARAEGLAG